MVPITVQSVTIEKLRRFTLFPSVAHCKARQIKKHFVFIDSMVPITVQSVTIEKLRRFTLFPSVRIAKQGKLETFRKKWFQ